MTTPATFTVSRAELADADRIAPLFDLYRVFYEQPSDPALARRFIHQRLENDESVIYYAVEPSGKILGFTQLYASFSSVSAKPIWILNDLYTIAEARKRGVGAALIDRARQLALDTGARGLALSTAHNNHTAQSLYEHLGFVQDKHFFHYFLTV